MQPKIHLRDCTLLLFPDHLLVDAMPSRLLWLTYCIFQCATRRHVQHNKSERKRGTQSSCLACKSKILTDAPIFQRRELCQHYGWGAATRQHVAQTDLTHPKSSSCMHASTFPLEFCAICAPPSKFFQCTALCACRALGTPARNNKCLGFSGKSRSSAT